MSRLIQFHQVKLKDTDATENRPAYCVRMFSTTMYYMCDLDVASLAHELVFLFVCMPSYGSDKKHDMQRRIFGLTCSLCSL